MPPDILWIPGGEHARCLLNTLFMWLLAFIGLVFLGYKHSYPEYLDPFQAENGDDGWLQRNYKALC